MSTYRVGIVGLRGIAAGPIKENPPYPLGRQITTSHASCLALMPEVEVVAYCDMDETLLTDFNNNWGETWPNAKPYVNFDK